MLRCVRLVLFLLAVLALATSPTLLPAQPAAFKLAPAVAVEAEDFTVADGWKVLANGQGNYMVDIIGFNHLSGERLLSLNAKATTGKASRTVQIPEDGAYKLWVRYEYPAFCECQFRVRIEQNGKDVFSAVLGKKESLRWAFGDMKLKAQHDPSWGPEGLMEEPVAVPELKVGPATIYLEGVEQPQKAGVSANRNIDLLYLTRDTNDDWLKHYHKRVNLYPLLEAFRDSRGPRWEVRFTNKADKAATFSIQHVYNRIPWGDGEGQVAKDIAPGASSEWIPLKRQDTTHCNLSNFVSSAGQLQVELRPVGGMPLAKNFTGPSPVPIYLPPYPNKGDEPTTPEQAIDAILAELKAKKAPGKVPTEPLCYGAWMPVGVDSAYGHKYAELYAALGMRSLHPALSGPNVLKNLENVGVKPTKSWAISGYRNPPTTKNIEAAQKQLTGPYGKHIRWFDYGDEIGFGEWMGHAIQETMAREKTNVKPEQIVQLFWLSWLKDKRPREKPIDYWLPSWGEPNLAALKPDSSATAARENPKLYVDSLLFYEDLAISFVADGKKKVQAALGADVLCGANYSCHPFYYPSSTMYIKWFRGGAADMGRHSEYFWQVAQAGPMINGYITEHFRAGLRDTPNGVIRQYTMPHAPGNTEASFLRSAYSHLAHGATMLDFFGIGMNECFTENHIDHRARERFVALRDVTHAIGFVEDLLPKSKVMPSPVALLVSESTERWDLAGIATDRAGHAHFGPDFRKTRLHYHLERLGLWKAFTFLGVSPDLLMESDLTDKSLSQYRLVVVVGDSLPPEKATTLQTWVASGGTVLATAGAGRYDSYKNPTEAYQKLFGLATRKTEEQETFFRPRQELPFLKPLTSVSVPGGKETWPALAVRDRITPADKTEIISRFADDNSPAVTLRSLGKGHVFYAATLPGVAYLWSGLQPPLVPDRGPGTHSIPENWDANVAGLLAFTMQTSGSFPLIKADPELIDARILKAPTGYLIPLANYNNTVGQKVTLEVRLKGINKVTSAYLGALEFQQDGEYLKITLPKLGYGDILRVE